LRIEAAESLIDFIIKNNDMKAVLFIDKTLAESIIDTIHGKLTIFVDGTFPQLENDNLQLWTILIRHNDRVSKTINSLVH